MKLAIDFTGRTFAEVASEIDGIEGNIRPGIDKTKATVSDDDRRRMMLKAWKGFQPIQLGDLTQR